MVAVEVVRSVVEDLAVVVEAGRDVGEAELTEPWRFTSAGERRLSCLLAAEPFAVASSQIAPTSSAKKVAFMRCLATCFDVQVIVEL